MKQLTTHEEMSIRRWLEYINNVMDGVSPRDKRDKWRKHAPQ